MEGIIYLDNNSSTKVDPRVMDVIIPYYEEFYGNSSSLHILGEKSHASIECARNEISNLIGCNNREIIFTSGATEAINLALKGLAENQSNDRNQIVTICTEHKAVLDACKHLQTIGFEVSYLPVLTNGLVDLNSLERAINDNTFLVCVMVANNEIGVIQPIKEIASLAHKAGAIFLTDATQAFGKIPIDVNEIGIDILTFSGHKFYAPKGIGGLYKRDTIKLKPQIHGGGHERNFRSGTLNVPGIVGLGKACEIAKTEMEDESERLSSLRDELETELLKIEGTKVNGNTEHRMPNVTNILFEGVDSDALIKSLNRVIVSNGSACTSASIEPSHVLLSLGLKREDAFSSIRLSLGRFNTHDEIKIAIQEMTIKVTRLGENLHKQVRV